MTSQQLPDCCTITLLSEFGNTDTAHDDTEYSTEEVDTFLKNAIIVNQYRKNILMAVINEDQYKKLYKTFKTNGFKTARKSYTPGHGNVIYILTRTNEAD